MWNRIKQAASNIWNKVKQVAKPVIKAVAPVAAPVFRPVQQAVNQAARWVAPAVQRWTPPNSAINRAAQQAAQQAAARAAQEAQRKAAAAAAAAAQKAAMQKKLQNTIASWTKKTTGGVANWGKSFGAGAAALWRNPVEAAKGVWKGSQWGIKQQQRQNLERQNAEAQRQAQQWMKQADSKLAQAGKDLAAGKISPDQYNALVDQERSKIERKANLWNQHFQEMENEIQKPVKTGWLGNALKKGMSYASPIGNVANAALWVMRQPRRAINTARKHLDKNAKFYDEVTNKQIDKGKGFWAPDRARVVNPGDPNDKFKLQFMAGGMHGTKAVRKEFTTPWSKSDVHDFLADPMWLAGGVGGLIGRGASKASKFPAIAKWLSRVSGVKSGAQGVLNTTAQNKWVKPLVNAGKWLNAPVKSPNQRYMDKVLKQSQKQFGKLNQAEIEAYQKAMLSGGKLPRNTNWARRGVDIKKVRGFVDENKKLYDEMYRSEQKAGIMYSKRSGYLPTKRQIDDLVKQYGDDLGNDFKTVPWFTRQKNLIKPGSLHAEDIAFGHGMRQYAHLKALDKLPKNRLMRAVKAPTKFWKKAVLKYRPAWYLYNAMWNTPASIMAGGRHTLGAYGKIAKAAAKERTLAPKLLQNLPDEVVTKGLYGSAEGIGKGGNLAEKIENLARGAAYMGSKGAGKTDAQAIKRVNRYLFNYGDTRNWERPLKAIFPFWNWQKNIARLTAQLPFTNPAASAAMRNIRLHGQERPLQEIPDEQQTFTDPETGKQISYSPRDAYKGKIKTPWGWRTAPFLPTMPEQLSQIGVSPWLSLINTKLTGKDPYNPFRDVNGEGFLDTIFSVFPQWNLGKAGINTLTKNPNQPGITDKWIAKGSGYTKERQGYDPTKPNYAKELDPAESFKALLKSYTGIGNFKNFDHAAYREKNNYYAFSKEYFGTDWYKAYPDYNKRDEARKALAKRYGYDLEKDIYKGKWAKYDTPETAARKEMKEAARALEQEVYAAYNALPKGKGSGGARGKFIQHWKQLMAQTDLLDRMPEFNVFKNVGIIGDTSKTPRNAGWSKFAGTTGSTGSGRRGSGRRYSPTANQKFWSQYYSLDKEGKKAMRAQFPDRFKFGRPDPRKAKIAWAYKNLPPDVRRNWLKKEGLTDPAKANWTSEQWDQYLFDQGLRTEDKLGRDLMKRPELGEMQLKEVEKIIASFNPIRRKDSTRNVVKWLNPRKRLTYR